LEYAGHRTYQVGPTSSCSAPSRHTFESDCWPLITGSRALVCMERTTGTRNLINGWGRYANGISARPPSQPGRARDGPRQIDNIAEVDDELRDIVARNWPHLLSKLPPRAAVAMTGRDEPMTLGKKGMNSTWRFISARKPGAR
jgi:hypothetical protein